MVAHELIGRLFGTKPCGCCQGAGRALSPRAGEYLREFREHGRVSIQEMADHLGVTRQYVSMLETAGIHWSPDRLESYLKKLRLEIAELTAKLAILNNGHEKLP